MTRTLLVIALLAAACNKADKDPNKTKPAAPSPTVDPVTAGSATAPPPEAPAPVAKPAGAPAAPGVAGGAPVPSAVDPSSTQPGPAYFGVDDVGVVKLDGGKITRVVENNYTIHEIVTGPKGVVYALAIGGLYKIEGGKASTIKTENHANYDRGAVGPDGVLWMTDRRGVTRYDGKQFTEEPPATFDNALIQDIAVDRAGRVWINTPDHLWKLEGAAWTRVDTGFTGVKQPFFSMVVGGPSGELYTSSHGGTFYDLDGAWHELALKFDFGSADEFAVGADGRIAASAGLDDVVLAAPGQPGRSVDLAAAGAKAKTADVLAVDGQGRTWIRTDNGLVILDRDGKLLQQWEPGTVQGIAGKVTAAAVIGAGPELPSTGPVATGTVTGKVLQKGKALAGAKIELCASPSMMFKKTPCDDASLTRTATTGADGMFSLANVPVGSFGFAVKPAGQWMIMLGSNCCTELEAGGSYDVGSITLD
jgi:sugar lactone lactonase YvrE